MLIGVGKADTQHNPVQKPGRTGRNTSCFEVVTGQEVQLVGAFHEGFALKQRTITAPVIIRDDRLYKLPSAGTGIGAFPVEFNGNSRAWHTFGGIKNMSSQTAHSHFARA